MIFQVFSEGRAVVEAIIELKGLEQALRVVCPLRAMYNIHNMNLSREWLMQMVREYGTKLGNLKSIESCKWA